ncbi:hypothetical protein B0T13DRAFT_65917 [Neurospora crassa]|nr:hypothetical protein B0T13DRAFT_65917 [Neurospora crassa]
MQARSCYQELSRLESSGKALKIYNSDISSQHDKTVSEAFLFPLLRTDFVQYRNGRCKIGLGTGGSETLRAQKIYPRRCGTQAALALLLAEDATVSCILANYTMVLCLGNRDIGNRYSKSQLWGGSADWVGLTLCARSMSGVDTCTLICTVDTRTGVDADMRPHREARNNICIAANIPRGPSCTAPGAVVVQPEVTVVDPDEFCQTKQTPSSLDSGFTM